MKGNINVIIVDDHFIIREGTKNILSQDPSIHVIGEASDGASALKLICEKQDEIDIIILDLNLPDMEGYQVLTELKSKNIKGKVMILSAYDTEEYLLKAKKLGADGYVMKTSSTTHLIEGIKQLAVGRKFFQDSENYHVQTETSDTKEAIKKINELTKREFEVLTLVSEGLNNRDIAKKLFISEKTVKNHLSSIFKKLDIDDRVQAVVFSYKHNIHN